MCSYKKFSGRGDCIGEKVTPCPVWEEYLLIRWHFTVYRESNSRRLALICVLKVAGFFLEPTGHEKTPKKRSTLQEVKRWKTTKWTWQHNSNSPWTSPTYAISITALQYLTAGLPYNVHEAGCAPLSLLFPLGTHPVPKFKLSMLKYSVQNRTFVDTLLVCEGSEPLWVGHDLARGYKDERRTAWA